MNIESHIESFDVLSSEIIDQLLSILELIHEQHPLTSELLGAFCDNLRQYTISRNFISPVSDTNLADLALSFDASYAKGVSENQMPAFRAALNNLYTPLIDRLHRDKLYIDKSRVTDLKPNSNKTAYSN